MNNDGVLFVPSHNVVTCETSVVLNAYFRIIRRFSSSCFVTCCRHQVQNGWIFTKKIKTIKFISLSSKYPLNIGQKGHANPLNASFFFFLRIGSLHKLSCPSLRSHTDTNARIEEGTGFSWSFDQICVYAGNEFSSFLLGNITVKKAAVPNPDAVLDS